MFYDEKFILFNEKKRLFGGPKKVQGWQPAPPVRFRSSSNGYQLWYTFSYCFRDTKSQSVMPRFCGHSTKVATVKAKIIVERIQDAGRDV